MSNSPMVRYTKSLPLDDVITHFEDKDLSSELSQKENREIWVEMIQADDDFSVDDLEKIVSDFYEIKKDPNTPKTILGESWQRPWMTEYEFASPPFGDGKASGWIRELEIRGESLFGLTRFNESFAEHLARQRGLDGRLALFKEYYVCLDTHYSSNPEDGQCTGLVSIIVGIGDAEKTLVPVHVSLPVLHVIECMSAMNDWDVSDLVDKSVTLGLEEILKNNVEIKAKPPERTDVMMFSVDHGVAEILSHLIKMIEDARISVEQLVVIFCVLKGFKKAIGKENYKKLRKNLKQRFRGSVSRLIDKIEKDNK